MEYVYETIASRQNVYRIVNIIDMQMLTEIHHEQVA